MVDTASAVSALVPAATFGPTAGGPDVVVTGTAITYWPPALGTQPTADQLAAVTADQVAAAQLKSLRSAASTLVLTGSDPSHVGTRAGDAAVITRLNDVCEGLWAALQVVCAAANLPVPTASQIAAQVAANRTATPVDAGATAPADVAAAVGVRLTGQSAVDLILGTVEAGGGDPIPPT